MIPRGEAYAKPENGILIRKSQRKNKMTIFIGCFRNKIIRMRIRKINKKFNVRNVRIIDDQMLQYLDMFYTIKIIKDKDR